MWYLIGASVVTLLIGAGLAICLIVSKARDAMRSPEEDSYAQATAPKETGSRW